MATKYLAKVDYHCPEVQMGGKWIVIERDSVPELGVIDPRPFKSGPLPGHGCKRNYYSQLCEEDTACNWQQILEVRPYSEEEARKLNAREFSGLELKAVTV